MIRNLTLAGVIAGGLSCAAAATAGVIIEESHSGSVALQASDWIESLSVPRFDDMDGARELISVRVHLDGAVSGSVAIESLDNAETTILAVLSARISLSMGETLLGVVSPIADDAFNATSFDGVVDFRGSSGMTMPTLAAGDADNIVLTAADAAFAGFLGAGMVELIGDARGASFGSGAGNLILQFNSSAEMAFRITYEFIEVPAPSSIMIFVGSAGLWGIRRRR